MPQKNNLHNGEAPDFEEQNTSIIFSFDDGLDGWCHDGPGQFELVRDGGVPTLTITIDDNPNKETARWYYDIDSITNADRMHVAALVRTDVADIETCDCYVEYFNQDGKQCGISRRPAHRHFQYLRDMDDKLAHRDNTKQIGWTSMRGWLWLNPTPRTARKARLNLSFSGSGTAWFRDIKLISKRDFYPELHAAPPTNRVCALQPCVIMRMVPTRLGLSIATSATSR